MDSHTIAFKVRLYRGQDNALIEWYGALDDAPFGNKAAEVKAALLRGIGDCTTRRRDAASPIGAISEESLVTLRQIVEAAVAAALAGMAVVPQTASNQGEDTSEANEILGVLGSTLLLGDEEGEI
ncbi:MAG: hypothetical protein JXA14_01985 [Anaerolineae bacterium]|nr:hypothetical protein [Anaerolineae bacterium]